MCDVSESCTGQSQNCPPDEVVLNGTICNGGGGDPDCGDLQTCQGGQCVIGWAPADSDYLYLLDALGPRERGTPLHGEPRALGEAEALYLLARHGYNTTTTYRRL